MAGKATKSAISKYYEARMRAAVHDDRLGSQERAAEMLNLSRDQLSKYERGVTRVPMENVVLMADIYNAPELLNFFCSNECPIGRCHVQELDVKSIELITLEMLGALRGAERAKDLLLDVTQDGIVSEEDRPALKQAIDYFSQLARITEELKLWAEKNTDFK